MVAFKYDAGMEAKFEFTETGEAVFSGVELVSFFLLIYIFRNLF